MAEVAPFTIRAHHLGQLLDAMKATPEQAAAATLDETRKARGDATSQTADLGITDRDLHA